MQQSVPVNISKFKVLDEDDKSALKASLIILIRIIEPMVPHLAEECWSLCGNSKSLTSEPWPDVDEKYLVKDTVKIVIQVNGKRRAEVETKVEASEEEVMKEVKNIKSVNEQLQNSVIIKKIFVPNELNEYKPILTNNILKISYDKNRTNIKKIIDIYIIVL